MASRIPTRSAAGTLSTTRTEHDALELRGPLPVPIRSASVIASNLVLGEVDRRDVERPLQQSERLSAYPLILSVIADIRREPSSATSGREQMQQNSPGKVATRSPRRQQPEGRAARWFLTPLQC